VLTLQRAIEIATAAHQGQLDKSGAPYIEHPLAVMAKVDGEDEQIVAVLHDVLEDTTVTVDDLRAEGATDRQVAGLLAVTRRDGEPYDDAVRRALSDPIGRVVKRADHEHNTDPARLALLPDDVAARLRRKYERVRPLFDEAATIR
jgi:hypothetical protein